jgi:hypothetical protein
MCAGGVGFIELRTFASGLEGLNFKLCFFFYHHVLGNEIAISDGVKKWLVVN